MTQSFTSVKARMPRDGDINSVGIYPERNVILVGGGDYTPVELMYRPYTHVPDLDIESVHWHANVPLSIHKEKKVDPRAVSTNMLSLLCRANAL